MLARFAALLPLVALGVRAAAIGCPVFDSDMNLYVFGGASDYVLGAQDSWSASSAKTLSATGTRPPFDGANPPRCYLSQFNNAIYVLGADSNNPTGIYIYNAATKAWSLQAVDAAGIDPNDQVEILDHDTNVIYALSQGRMWFVNLEDQKDAKTEKLAYTDMGTKPAFDTSSYKATMGIASNHIHFFGTPGSKPGDASIFVIHYAYPQPELQAYPSVAGKLAFPVSHGQSPALFQSGNPAQRQIAFIPDDMSATYIVDVKVNETLPLAGPTDKSAGSIFTASINSVVQLTPSGKLFFLPVDQSDIAGKAANGGAAWKSLATLPASSSTTPGTGGTGNGNTTPGTTDGSSDDTPSGGNANQADPDNTADGDNAAGRMASLSALALLVPVVAALFF
ncbi:hypothetical protein AURDEDRAFT_110301 [Auricularia subglabra TFB-10046 SS5]|nr:hypothetical protein AURDEDRAFT_110301 [Auricularia subglabra TFB-10046 SS5]